MDSQSYSRLLSYIVCEVTMPVKKHVINFAVSDQMSVNPQLLSAVALTAKIQRQKHCLHPQQLENNMANNIKMDLFDADKETGNQKFNKEVLELCEDTGSKIENNTVGEMLKYESCRQNEVDNNTVSAPEGQSDEILSLEEENEVTFQPEPKRRCYSPTEDKTQPVQLDSLKVEDLVTDRIEEYSKCYEIPGNASGSNNCIINWPNTDSTLNSDNMLPSNDNDFKNMFKVSHSTFQILIEILSGEELEPIEDVPLYKKVLIVLWLLGTAGSYKDASQKFGVSEEAVASCFFDICATLYNKSENFIKWPSSGESDEIASRIEKNFGFPGVAGVLGCQYFRISIPKETLSRREHFNGKLRMYCVALQLVCDDEFVIRDIFPGLPGGIRPAQILRDSPLGELLTTQPNELIDPNKHILAGSEFPQLMSMLTPYSKNSQSLNKEEEEFNDLHGHVCLLVDQTFQMLQDRFRVLKLLDPEVATMVLVTTSVLHNICIQNGDTYDLVENV